MNRKEFVLMLEEIAPPGIAEEFDSGRIGLITQGTDEINKIACALDATPKVCEIASANGFDALVVHHPAFWTAMHGVCGRSAEILRPLMKNNVNLYAMHTNFDHADGGINDSLADLIGLTNRVRMNQTPNSIGIVGDLTKSFDEIADLLGCGLRVWGDIRGVKRIAAVGGSGFEIELIDEASDLGAEAFLSAELKYNVALESPIPCIEAAHHALEAPGMRALAERKGWAFIEDIPQTSFIDNKR